ncbi:MAG: DUF4293 domain-containing protein [Bacteroidota bacterium]
MLQRIQTIYFLLATACVLCMYAFDFALIDVVKEQYIFNSSGITVNEKNVTNLPYQVVIALLAVYTTGVMLLYKKRPLQLKLGRLNYLLHLFLIVMMFFGVDDAAEATGLKDAAVIKYGIGFYLPIAALPFLFLANRAIKRDEEIVKSLDRLR